MSLVSIPTKLKIEVFYANLYGYPIKPYKLENCSHRITLIFACVPGCQGYSVGKYTVS